MNTETIPNKANVEKILTKQEIISLLKGIAGEPTYYVDKREDERGVGLCFVESSPDKNGDYRVYQYARAGFTLPITEKKQDDGSLPERTIIQESSVLVIYYNKEKEVIDTKYFPCN